MIYVSMFCAGAFLCNGIPHLVSGLQGKPFPTPFAIPSGVGNSSPLINFLWGALNLAIGSYLLLKHRMDVEFMMECLSSVLGAFLMGVYASRHFGRVQQNKDK